MVDSIDSLFLKVRSHEIISPATILTIQAYSRGEEPWIPSFVGEMNVSTPYLLARTFTDHKPSLKLYEEPYLFDDDNSCPIPDPPIVRSVVREILD